MRVQFKDVRIGSKVRVRSFQFNGNTSVGVVTDADPFDIVARYSNRKPNPVIGNPGITYNITIKGGDGTPIEMPRYAFWDHIVEVIEF